MRERRAKFASEYLKILLVERDDVARIQEIAKTDKKAALELLGKFIDAGSLIVGKGLHARSSNAFGMTAITKGQFQAQFEKEIRFFTPGGETGITKFYGNGETEDEAIDSFYDHFFDDMINQMTTMKDDFGPLFVWSTSKTKYRFFQLDRR